MVRLSERRTNELKDKLTERKYGRRLNSTELAQKAGVPLDYVNRFESQLPIDDPKVAERIAHALGVTPDLLRKVAGYEEMAEDELSRLEQCLLQPGESAQGSAEACERLGLRRVS